MSFNAAELLATEEQISFLYERVAAYMVEHATLFGAHDISGETAEGLLIARGIPEYRGYVSAGQLLAIAPEAYETLEAAAGMAISYYPPGYANSTIFEDGSFGYEPSAELVGMTIRSETGDGFGTHYDIDKLAPEYAEGYDDYIVTKYIGDRLMEDFYSHFHFGEANEDRRRRVLNAHFMYGLTGMGRFISSEADALVSVALNLGKIGNLPDSVGIR